MPLTLPGSFPPTSCPQCGASWGSGGARPLREQCGHTRCYTCTYATQRCPLCPPGIGGGRSGDSEGASPVRGGLRSTSASPCRYRSDSFRGSPSSRGSSPAPLPPLGRPAPYYHHHVHGASSSTRPGRRRSRRVSVPLPLPPRRTETRQHSPPPGMLYGLPSSPPPVPLLPPTPAEERDLYARFQLMLCSSPAPASRPPSSGGSSGRHLHSEDTSPFSTLTGSSGMERQRPSPEDSLYGDRLYCDKVYCSPLYAEPRVGTALVSKPPLPTSRTLPTLSRSTVRPPVRTTPQPCVETEFVGRAWLFEEMDKHVTSESPEHKGVAITGAIGTGKTAAIIKILDHLDAYQSSCNSEIYSEPISSVDSSVNSLASRVAAYHFCLSGDANTWLVPDFVHSIASQMYKCQRLQAYRELLQSDSQSKSCLSLSSCIADPAQALHRGVFVPLQKLRRRGKLPKDPILILIDGLPGTNDSVAFNTHSLASFLENEMKNAPAIIKFIVTIRSDTGTNTRSYPLHNISLDFTPSCPNALLKADLTQYVSFRCEHSERINCNISVTPDAFESDSVIDRFTQHIVNLSNGSIFYLKLIINLIENGLLVLKSGSFKILPQSLSEIFLLMFNIKFPTTSSYEKHKPIFNVVLAAQTPLTLLEIYQGVCAGLLYQFPSWSQFLLQFKTFKDLLRKRHDNTYVFFHPALREWLVKRSRGDTSKFLCDVSVGHSYLALKLSRLDGPLQEKKTLELAYHVVQSKAFENETLSHHITVEEYQALWITQSSLSPSAALSFSRNIFHPNVEISRLLLMAGASADQTTEFMKNSSVLGVASYLGFDDFVSLLLEFGADPNLTNNDGDTPLLLAASAGHVEITKSLVSHGANVTVRNGLEETALVKAAASGHLSIVSFLLTCKWPQLMLKKQAQQALVTAARHGHAQTMDHLIQFSEELINGVDTLSGDTALTAASKSGQVDTIKCLFQWRASKVMRNRKGESPLCCAVQNGHYEACKLLLDYGAEVDDRNEDGRTPLIVAATEGHFGLMELLTAQGASLTHADQDGLTALSWACLLGKRHAVQYLVDQGADVNHADHCSRTPLDLAAHNGSAIVVRLLMERGALIEHADLSGMRPLDRAISAGNTEAIECFLQKGAKLGPTTWALAASTPRIVLILLHKLKEDGITLLRKNRLKEAAHRFSYALRKIPTDCENEDLRNTFATLKLHLTLNLSRTKRKMNELGDAIQLANEALQLSKDSYESYYARAQAKRKAGKLDDALEDIDQALRLIPEMCISGNIHRCLTDVRQEIVADLNRGCSTSPTPAVMQTSLLEPAPQETDGVMTSSILSESGYSSNF